FYSAAAAIYLVFSILSGVLQSRLERRANRGFA
ncbi:MAG: ABC transporter permease, partial [Hyphomicrobiales bacterium]|nr:ABC transporter permease [Hyphomicrobiales bacterium]